MKNMKYFLPMLWLGLSMPVFSQPASFDQLVASRNVADQDFGYAIDLDRDIAVVGAFRNSDGLILGSGAVFIYQFDGVAWEEEAMLEETEPDFLNWFGWDVAVSGDVLVVSSRNGDQSSLNGGDVSVYRRVNEQWVYEAGLTPSLSVMGDYGVAVEVDRDLIAVGDPVNSAVHLFRYDGANWVMEQVLEQPDPGIQDQFGAALAIDGDRILVSAFNADDATWNQAGRLFIYKYDGAQWQEEAILESINSNNIANLGVAVSLEGEWAIAGAPLDKEAYGSTAGAVLIYHNDGNIWSVHSKIFPSDGPGFYQFGSGVALSGHRLAVGADNWFPLSGGGTGKVYLFAYDVELDAWVETGAVIPDELPQGANFGHDVSMQDDVLLVGAPEYDGDLENMGAAFLFGTPQQATSIASEQPAPLFQVSSPFPNPFSSATTFEILMKEAGLIRVTLYDMLGREVKHVFAGRLQAGNHKFEIPGVQLPEGVYWMRVQDKQGMSIHSITRIR